MILFPTLPATPRLLRSPPSTTSPKHLSKPHYCLNRKALLNRNFPLNCHYTPRTAPNYLFMSTYTAHPVTPLMLMRITRRSRTCQWCIKLLGIVMMCTTRFIQGSHMERTPRTTPHLTHPMQQTPNAIKGVGRQRDTVDSYLTNAQCPP